MEQKSHKAIPMDATYGTKKSQGNPDGFINIKISF